MTNRADPDCVLAVSNLTVSFANGHERVDAVRDVSFEVRSGETLTVLGESGSGKSVTMLAVMGLLGPNAQVTGRAELLGTDLVGLSRAARRRARGSNIAMVFQDALSALNPVRTVGSQIAELVRVHHGANHRESYQRGIELLDRVRIPDARSRSRGYPHQLSGGMRQRVLIAMALALQPQILIADEPTTALDVTIQSQILRLLADLQEETGMALILITHDIAIGAAMADRLAVMYAGRIVESGPSATVYRSPSHPYTRALIDATPRHTAAGERLAAIPGSPPVASRLPAGCAFHPRCRNRTGDCLIGTPPRHTISAGHHVECQHPEYARALH